MKNAKHSGDHAIRATLAAALAKSHKATVAAQAGIHRPNLYRVLAPGANPTLEVVERLAAALGFELVACPIAPRSKARVGNPRVKGKRQTVDRA